MQAGTRDRVEDFYALVWRDAEDQWHRVLDPLADSLPFGAMAPTELYDLSAMQATRGDADYFRALKPEGDESYMRRITLRDSVALVYTRKR